jgi:hypothetical protein
MDKLNYQQASNIRNRSLKDLIADELIRGKGIGGALGGAIGLRTQARIKGIKEKFDPLNIVKFLTFGSRLGPALYGRLFGRSRKDIEYFTGRASAIGSKATKIGPLRNGDEDIAGMKAILNQILTFLNKSHERDMILREKENNLRESNKLDDDRRHKELLKALGQNIPTIISEEVEKENNFGKIFKDIFSKLKGLADVVSSLKDALIEVAKKLGMPLAQGLMKLGRWGWLAATNPITGFVIAGTTLGTGVYGILNSYSDEQLKQVAESGDTGAEMAAVILAGRDKTDADRVLQDERNERIQQLLKEYKASFPLRSYGAPEQHRKFLEEKGLRRADLDQLFPDVEAGPEIVNPRQMKGKLELQTTPTPPPAAPPEPVMDQTPESGKLNVVTKENVSLNLPTNTTNKALDDATVNKVINTPQRTGKKIPMPAVRNLEASFQRMIINSTRVV